MDYRALVEAIATRVSELLMTYESMDKHPACDKPKLLALTQKSGDSCHTIPESKRIGECCRIVCVTPEEYRIDEDEFECAVLYDLSNDALAKIAGGICDTSYTALIMKFLLLGKRLFISRDQIELFRYESAAPTHYYGMLREKLALLEQSGLVICRIEEMEDRILCGLSNPSAGGSRPARQELPKAKAHQEYKLEKRIISERDMKSLEICGVTVLRVGAKAILTDLAKEYAHTKGVEIIRG